MDKTFHRELLTPCLIRLANEAGAQECEQNHDGQHRDGANESCLHGWHTFCHATAFLPHGSSAPWNTLSQFTFAVAIMSNASVATAVSVSVSPVNPSKKKL